MATDDDASSKQRTLVGVENDWAAGLDISLLPDLGLRE